MAVRVEPGYIEQLNEIYHFFQMGFKMSFVVIGVIRWKFSMMFSRVFTDEKVDHLAP